MNVNSTISVAAKMITHAPLTTTINTATTTTRTRKWDRDSSKGNKGSKSKHSRMLVYRVSTRNAICIPQQQQNTSKMYPCGAIGSEKEAGWSAGLIKF